jgi:hypothetical protein
LGQLIRRPFSNAGIFRTLVRPVRRRESADTRQRGFGRRRERAASSPDRPLFVQPEAIGAPNADIFGLLGLIGPPGIDFQRLAHMFAAFGPITSTDRP